MPDATTLEAVALVKRLRAAAVADEDVWLSDVTHGCQARAYARGMDALRNCGFYRCPTRRGRRDAIDRAIATLEASDG